jgi:hypothetical protein
MLLVIHEGIKDDEMGDKCRTDEIEEEFLQILAGNLKEREK